MPRRMFPLLLFVLLVLTACGPSESIVIPTVIALPSLPPEVVATQTAAAYLTSVAPPTLPATWTPLPPPSPTAESLLEASPTLSGPAATDRLLFVADGVIYSVRTDGTDFGALTGHLEARDLILSPDGTQLAFVGRGQGSGFELYALDLTTDQLRQVTSLGYGDMADPAWHPDSLLLTFAAGQYAGREREVYTIRSDGQALEQRTVLSQNTVQGTPTGNEVVTGTEAQLSALGLSDPVFMPDGSGIVFAAPGLALLDLNTRQYRLLSITSGWGNDTYPRWRPGTDELVYIRPGQNLVGYPGGALHVISLATTEENTIPPLLADVYAQSFQFSADGRWMVIAAGFEIYIFDYGSRSARPVVDTGNILAQATINADGSRIAYFAANSSGGTAPQLVINDKTGRSPRVIMDVDALVLGEMVWVDGE